MPSLPGDDYANDEAVAHSAQVCGQRGSVENDALGVVDECNNGIAVRMRSVTLDVFNELVTNLTCVQAFPRHLGLHDDAFLLQQEVKTGAPAGAFRDIVLGSHVVEM